VYAALRKVVLRHPALSVVTGEQPSQTKKGQREQWMGRLKALDLRDYVMFEAGGDEGFSGVIEREHNAWFETADKSRALGRLRVLAEKHVLFVYHHIIADGLSGFAFHRAFLEKLNSIARDEPTPAQPTGPVVTIDTESCPLPPDAMEITGRKPSILKALKLFLSYTLLRLVVSRSRFYFFDTTYPESIPSFRHPPAPHDRTVTRVRSFTLSKATMAKCIAACRQHETTFTALLHTLLHTTLAADIYPRATIGISTRPVCGGSLRPT
jgi:hypothetical protein